MPDEITALKETLENLNRELALFEIDTACRYPVVERQSAITSLCEQFQKQMATLLKQDAVDCRRSGR